MKNNALRVVNLLLYLSGCFMAGTGILLAWRLPPGSRGGHGLSALGMTRHEWGDWHLYAGILVVALSIVHLVLNRAWLEKIAASRKRWRLAGGLLAGLAVIVGLALLPVQRQQDERGGHGGRGHARQSGG